MLKYRYYHKDPVWLPQQMNGKYNSLMLDIKIESFAKFICEKTTTTFIYMVIYLYVINIYINMYYFEIRKRTNDN